ncbi:thioredoxin, mitochondrial [Uranotaenia lowii]|uniref:thioredoxin, mitochondrial n=1 Tax=Uranotaenia lowii TaxID=190385 RepID=UPI002479CF7C|nr:thioredoxin, mitochondrial [Uranotaenia lowii]
MNSLRRLVTGASRLSVVSRSNNIRTISTSSGLLDIFKIQSPQEFDEKVKNSKDPIIVDFFATWCGPCKMLTPRIESVIGEQGGKVKLAKVDIDEHSDLALDYEVASVPVLLAIRNGKVEQRLIGLQDTDKLRNWVENVVGEKK